MLENSTVSFQNIWKPVNPGELCAFPSNGGHRFLLPVEGEQR